MRKLLMATAAIMGATGGLAYAQTPANPSQGQLAAPYGAGPAKDFLRRGFRLAPDAACGDQDPAVYLAQVKVMEREFLRLAAE